MPFFKGYAVASQSKAHRNSALDYLVDQTERRMSEISGWPNMYPTVVQSGPERETAQRLLTGCWRASIGSSWKDAKDGDYSEVRHRYKEGDGVAASECIFTTTGKECNHSIRVTLPKHYRLEPSTSQCHMGLWEAWKKADYACRSDYLQSAKGNSPSLDPKFVKDVEYIVNKHRRSIQDSRPEHDPFLLDVSHGTEVSVALQIKDDNPRDQIYVLRLYTSNLADSTLERPILDSLSITNPFALPGSFVSEVSTSGLGHSCAAWRADVYHESVEEI